jgi:hypothetical protein
MRRQQGFAPRLLALWTVLAAGGTTLAAERPVAIPTAIFKAARTAVAEGSLDRTRQLGSPFTKDTFSEVPAEGGVLVGFDFALMPWMGDSEVIQAVRPIYLTLQGERSYHEYGKFTETRPRQANRLAPATRPLRQVRVTAEAGYAVGGLKLRAGMFMDGMVLTFMRIRGAMLDPEQSYTSNWVGNSRGGSEGFVSSEGRPVVGVFGHEDDQHVLGLGLILLRPPAAPAPVIQPEERPTTRPAEKRAEREVEAPPAAVPAAPAVDAEPAAAAPPAGPTAPGKTSSRAATEVSWVPFVATGIVLIPLFLALLVFISWSRAPVRPARKVQRDDEEILDVLPADPEPSVEVTGICTKPNPLARRPPRTEPERPAAPPGSTILRCSDCRVRIGPRGDGTFPDACPRCGGMIVLVAVPSPHAPRRPPAW